MSDWPALERALHPLEARRVTFRLGRFARPRL
jgi:hypothetical protein